VLVWTAKRNCLTTGGTNDAVRRMTTAQRRARLGARHHLAPTAAAATPVEVARGVLALHSTDPASVFLAIRARAPQLSPEATERALYDERSLIRLLGMRRTMFVVPIELAPVIQAACTKAIAEQQRRRYTQLVVAAGVGDGAWLAELEDAAARALAVRGEATGAQLSVDVPQLRTPLLLADGKSYSAVQNVTTWVLALLAADGRIIRGRPRGSWTSSQYRWSPARTWLPTGVPELPVEAARVELVRRWLAAYGPGTVADLRWWTGWTSTAVKQALTALQPAEVALDSGQTGLLLPDDGETAAAPASPEPWIALLPALDPSAMGWAERSWYLGAHAPALFDRSGNIGPTIWADGRIVGGWAQRAGGDVVFRLLEDLGSQLESAVAEAAAGLAGWIGAIRVTPRFRTPLERELTA
jgi:Winged helix DNA-binding domain